MRECGTCHHACSCREERMRLLERIAVAAHSAMKEIHAQKVMWPGEVDTLDDELRALDALGEG